MSTEGKVTKPAAKKAITQRKVAKPKAALPEGATVATVTIGQAIAEEMRVKGITGANSVTVKNNAGELVTIHTFTAGQGNLPASDFNLDTLKFQISGKAA